MTIKERIEIFIERQGIKRSVFEKSCGFSNGYTRNLKENPSATKIEDILNAYPELNRVWLLSGEGNMLKSDSDAAYSEDSVEDGYYVPLVPISVMAGELTSFDSEGVEARNCERVVSPIKGVDLAFPVLGDSMEPEYPNGSKVFVMKINHYDFIAFGNVYVLDTTNGPLLKKVKRSEHEGCIKCVSLNEAAGYEPFDVPLRTVRAMYRVIMCLSLKG